MESLETTTLIEEYKELRAEIRHYLSRRQNTRNFAYLITLAVLGSDFITSSKLPAQIFVIPPLLILCLWADEIGRLKAIQRLGTYIKIFIEPKSEQLNYESLGLYPTRRIGPVSRIVANLDFPILFIALTGLCSWKFYEWKYLLSGVIVTVILLIILLILLREAYMVAKRGVNHEESHWLMAKGEIEKQIKESSEAPEGTT